MDSCKPSKVRTYACNEDGYRIIKYFNYEYDFGVGECQEHTRKKEVKCTDRHVEESDDDEVLSFKKYK